MRVLHIHSGNLYGGVETTLAAQARYKTTCPSIDLSFALCFPGRFSEEIIAAGAAVSWLGSVRVRQPYSIRRARRRLRELLETKKIDVAVTHSAWSQAIFGPIARAASLPLVFFLHGEARGQHWTERWARRTRPDLVLCNSHFTASTLDRLYSGIPAEVVYNPLVPPDWKPHSPDERRAIRAELGISDNTVVIIQVGRMEEGKGHEVHLRALGSIKDMPRWVCWQVGGAERQEEKNYLHRLKRLAEELGIAERVRFWGQRTDVLKLLLAADIYCQPNISPEGFGHSFIEALLSGLPIITTAIGGAKEIVDDSCGLLVPPNDANALKASLLRLIENPIFRRHLGGIGPLRAQSLCHVAKQMQLLHQHLAAFNA